jgi:hypothetical protein
MAVPPYSRCATERDADGDPFAACYATKPMAYLLTFVFGLLAALFLLRGAERLLIGQAAGLMQVLFGVAFALVAQRYLKKARAASAQKAAARGEAQRDAR